MKAKEVYRKLLVGALLVATLITPNVANAMSRDTVDTFSKYQTTKEQIQTTSSPMQVYVQDSAGGITKMNLNYPVMVLNSRSAVAVKDVTDNLKADLSWDSKNKIATINKDGNEIAYPINKRVMATNDKIKDIDTNATIYAKENRTYLPFASLAEALGMQAIWTPKGTNGAINNSIILAPIGVKPSQIPSSIQPLPPVPPVVIVTPGTPPANTDSKYLTADQIEWVFKYWEKEGITRDVMKSEIAAFSEECSTPENEIIYRESLLKSYYSDIAIPKGWDKKIKVSGDIIYDYAGAVFIQGIEFKTENGKNYQRLVFIPVNFSQGTGDGSDSVLYVIELADGSPYNTFDWVKMN